MLEGGELAVLLCLCALIGCLALALPALAQTPADGNLEGQLDSLIRAQMRERKIVGVAVAVVRSGKVDWEQAARHHKRQRAQAAYFRAHPSLLKDTLSQFALTATRILFV